MLLVWMIKDIILTSVPMQGLPDLAPEALNICTGLLASNGETWKTGRHTLTPSFSGMKMKLVRYNTRQ